MPPRDKAPTAAGVSRPPSRTARARRGYRVEEHVGECKLALWAATREELFREGARFVAAQCGPTRGGSGAWEVVALRAHDEGALLVAWLNELIGRSEAAGRAYADIRGLRLRGASLEAEVRGRAVARFRSPLKAATYHGLVLTPEGEGVRAVVLFDV